MKAFTRFDVNTQLLAAKYTVSRWERCVFHFQQFLDGAKGKACVRWKEGSAEFRGKHHSVMFLRAARLQVLHAEQQLACCV